MAVSASWLCRVIAFRREHAMNQYYVLQHLRVLVHHSADMHMPLSILEDLDVWACMHTQTWERHMHTQTSQRTSRSQGTIQSSWKTWPHVCMHAHTQIRKQHIHLSERTSRSHGTMQSSWKSWPQGNSSATSPALKALRHTLRAE